jgi:hypothetical protein
MLLLVVGLVVLVLVIVVVVFLSVRTMHVEDDDGYGLSGARRDTGGPNSAERDSGARRLNGGAMNGGGPRRGESAPGAARARSSQPAPAARAGQPVPAARRRPSGDVQPGPGGRAPAVRRGGDRDRDQQRIPALPRPRGYGHDQDAGDWGGVSDEQYWADLSSDNPLSTTARSAQAGPPPASPSPFPGRAHSGAPTQRLRRPAGDSAQFGDPRSGESRLADPQPGNARFGGKQFRDPAGAPDLNDTNPGTDAGRWAAQDAPTSATSAWRADSPRGAAQAAEPSTPGTDAGRWAAQDAPTSATSAWRADSPRGAAQAAEPSTEDWPARDTAQRGWDAQEAHEPSRSGADEMAGDWRADEPSADRWAAGAEPGGGTVWDADSPLARDAFSLHGARSARAGEQDGYDTHRRQADYHEPYGSHQGAGSTYQSGALEPLPEPAGRTADWHSAPVPSGNGFAADRNGHGWDNGGGYDSGHDSGHGGYLAADQPNGYAASGSGWEPGAAGDGWADREQQGWADPEPGYGRSSGYHPDQGYGDTGPVGGSHDEPGSYALPGSHHGHDPAYNRPGYDATDDGYGERAGYGQQPRHGYGR